MNKKKLLSYILLFIFINTLSFFDISISSFLYTKNPSYFFLFIYKYFNIIPISLLVIILFLFIYSKLKKINFINNKDIIFIITLLITSQGLIQILKKYWGRPRPRETIELNINASFNYKHPWQFNKALSNSYPLANSFPSGHAGFSFFTIFLYFLLKAKKNKYKNLALYFVITFSSLVSLGRIIQGGHFLSDTLFAIFITLLFSKLSYFYIYKN